MDQPFEHVIRVGWGDCDPARIAYTARIPAWALESIDAWWEHHLSGDGWFQMETDRNVGTPFVNLSMDFRSPITPRHRLLCRVWPTKLGYKSITFRVEGVQNGQLCFEGSFTCVFTIADKFISQSPPEEIRAIVEPLIRA
ncbi:MAG: thioesterase family protein [Aestuariivita sp.]|uniref:acyl-CoA thioesterase n=1 Tax=Aestuariivita sp. TaxID=1872407 RepID=UPI003BAF2D5E